MPVTLTIKNVPDELAERLRTVATSHHRSLQGELMAIIEAVGRLHEPGKTTPDFQCWTTTPAAERDKPTPEDTPADNLPDQLDAIVAGSQWGRAPMLTRDQVHDRALARELDYQVQEEKARYKP